MLEQAITIKDFYTRKVGGETYDYELRYTPGPHANWSASVFRDGDLKGSPAGIVTENIPGDDALRRHIVAIVESIIEVAKDIDE